MRRLQTNLSVPPQTSLPRALSLGCHTQGAFARSLCGIVISPHLTLSAGAEATILPEGKFSFLCPTSLHQAEQDTIPGYNIFFLLYS